MGYQWLRVYPEDLLGDVKARQLSDAEKWYMILAWQTARNAKAYGELRNDDGSPITYREFALVAGIPEKKANLFLCKLLALGLAEPADDGACVFPKLRQMQGDDRTHADRQAKYRASKRGGDAPRDAESDGQSDGAVTPYTHTPYLDPKNDHPSSVVEPRLNDLLVKAEDIDPDIRGEIQRLAAAIPNGERSVGRLVKLARAGRPQAAFADARAGYEAVKARPGNPGAYVCDLVEKYGGAA